MTSAAFSMPDDRRRRVSLRRRSTNSSTVTSRAADDALQQVMTRRSLKRDGRVPSPPTAAAGSLADVRESLSGVLSGICLLKVALLLVVGLAMWTGLSILTAAPPDEPRHAVRGMLTLNGRPLSHSIVEFHLLDPPAGQASPIQVAYTDDAGAFAFGAAQTPGLPAGHYAVVARGRRRVVRHGESELVDLPLPKAYANPEQTPLKVSVSEDTSGVRLAVRK